MALKRSFTLCQKANILSSSVSSPYCTEGWGQVEIWRYNGRWRWSISSDHYIVQILTSPHPPYNKGYMVRVRKFILRPILLWFSSAGVISKPQRRLHIFKQPERRHFAANFFIWGVYCNIFHWLKPQPYISLEEWEATMLGPPVSRSDHSFKTQIVHMFLYKIGGLQKRPNLYALVT